MASDLTPSDLGTTLLQTFYSVLTTGTSTAGTYLSYIDGGSAFTANDLAFLTDLSWMSSANPKRSHLSVPELLQAAHNFMSVVDSIPPAVGTWVHTDATVGSIYQNVFLGQGNAASPQVDDGALKAAQSTIKQDQAQYIRYRNSYTNAVSRHNALNSRRPPASESELTEAAAAVSDALSDWQDLGNKAEYEAAEGVLANASTGFAEYLHDLVNLYTDYISNYALPDGTQFAPVMAIPPDFATGNVQWNRFSFDSSSVTKTTSDTSSTVGGDLSAAAGLFLYSADTSGSGNWQAADISTSTLTVSFDYLVVDLDRSAWFDSILLTSRAWWLNGMTAQDPTPPVVFSDGAPPPNTTGEWQMWAESVIFIRNLTIDFGSENKQSAQDVMNLQENAQVNFLIFPLAGETTDVTNSTTKFSYTSSDSAITAAQMQMMFFLCRLMPPEPNPLPDLLPQN